MHFLLLLFFSKKLITIRNHPMNLLVHAIKKYFKQIIIIWAKQGLNLLEILRFLEKWHANCFHVKSGKLLKHKKGMARIKRAWPNGPNGTVANEI